MKRYAQYFLSSFVIVNLLYIILTWMILRRREIIMPFLRLELGAMIIALITALAYFVYRSEKGHAIINVIMAYILLLPSLYVFRANFGRYLFRSAAFIYIIFIVLGVIYSMALFMASKKYKHEVNDLNALLRKNESDKEKTPKE